jgi:hypothetical protein
LCVIWGNILPKQTGSQRITTEYGKHYHNRHLQKHPIFVYCALTVKILRKKSLAGNKLFIAMPVIMEVLYIKKKGRGTQRGGGELLSFFIQESYTIVACKLYNL